MEFNEVVKNRFSCKSFSSKQIDDEVLERILKTANLAPTAKNTQEHKIYVIRSSEMLAKVDSATPCRYNAPTVLALTYVKDEAFVYPGSELTSGVEDATIVATHLFLSATNEGVDTCYVNAFNPDAMHTALGLPDNEALVMLLDMGYKSEDAKPLDNHYNRKELEKIVIYI